MAGALRIELRNTGSKPAVIPFNYTPVGYSYSVE